MKKILSIIHILVEEYREDGNVYFLGTSPELDGLLIEADSIEQLKKEAPGVIKMYIEAVNEVEENEKTPL